MKLLSGRVAGWDIWQSEDAEGRQVYFLSWPNALGYPVEPSGKQVITSLELAMKMAYGMRKTAVQSPSGEYKDPNLEIEKEKRMNTVLGCISQTIAQEWVRIFKEKGPITISKEGDR